MPEGDTIHATARVLRRVLAGQVIVRCECDLAVVDDWVLAGRTVDGVEARGKNLLIHCAALAERRPGQPAEGPALPVCIWTHMGMEGSWHTYRPGERWRASPAEAKIVLHTDRRVVPCFSPKGLALLGPQGLRRHPALANLGPDLLDPDASLDEGIHRLRALRGVALGDAIMRQSAVSGIGNVYKSELLFLEQLDPFVEVATVAPEVLRALLERARGLMAANLAAGGARRTRFELGDPHGQVWVYRRSGLPCRVCGTIVAMRRQGRLARSTYFCPSCQFVSSA